MKRTALIMNKTLSVGEQMNAVAILAADLSAHNEEMIDSEYLLDQNGNRHAGIKNNLVILTANPTAVLTFAETVRENHALDAVFFSKKGQSLSNSYEEYQYRVSETSLADLEPAGVGIFGDDAVVRALTKKFSLLK